MANPQIENGYTSIANEILEKLVRMPLAPNQWRVLLCIIRKTYGWHKKVDYIANFQIGEATGLCKAVVSRCLKGLSDMHLITRKGKYIGFQKDWEKWRKLAIPSTFHTKLAEQSTSEKLAESSTELAESSTKVSSCAVTQKKKETIQKKRNQAIKKSPDPLNEFRKKVFEGLKERRGNNSPVPGAEATAINWMLKQEYTVEQILNSYDVLKRDPFWADKFLSMQSVKTQIGEMVKKRLRAFDPNKPLRTSIERLKEGAK